MIIDEVKIYLKAGSGGEGHLSFMRMSRNKFAGGGGDGGRGGNIIFEVSPHLYDLSKFKGGKYFVAENGDRGKDNNKKGKGGNDVIVPVPLGTIVRDLEGNVIVDLNEPDERFLICHGGKGGEGNYKKEYTIPRELGEHKDVVLDYRAPIDVAVIGFPNSGKTALINKMSGKTFKVAHYPFTTVSPVWVRAQYHYQEFIVLDTPALVRDSGLKSIGNGFLKHLLRAKVILFLSENHENYEQEFSILKKEIMLFDKELLKDKKLFYLLTKIDTIKELKFPKKFFSISVEKDINIKELMDKITTCLVNNNDEKSSH